MNLPAMIAPAPLPATLPREKAALRAVLAAACQGVRVTHCPPQTYSRSNGKRWTAPRATGRPHKGAKAPA